jgi:hypothetical protein
MKLHAALAFFIAFCWSFFAGDSLGTESSFRIIDYKPAGFRTQSLDLSPSLMLGGLSTLDSNSYYGRMESSRGTGSLNANASHYLRSQKPADDLETSTKAYVTGTTYARTEEQSKDNTISYYKQNSPDFNYKIFNSTRYRKYVAGNVFLEGAASPSIAHQPGGSEISESSSIIDLGTGYSGYHTGKNVDKTQQITLSSGFTGSVGMGWIADFTAAAIALHIADCIARLKGQPQKFTTTKMQDLALAVDRLRRRRIFDSRLANIESVDTLCQILVAEKCVDTATVRLAMEINDIWNYGFSQQRQRGKEIRCSPTAIVYYDRAHGKSSYYSVDSTGPTDPSITAKDVSKWPKSLIRTSEPYYTDFLLTYGAVVYTGFSNPYGRYFELDGSIEVSGTMNTLYDSTYTTDNRQGLFKGTYPNATGKLVLSLSWFPTLRTTITLYNRLTGSGDFYFRSRTVSGTTNFDSWTFSQRRLYRTEFITNLGAKYFLSQRCSYNVSASIQYVSGTKRGYAAMHYSNESGLRRWNFYFSTGLTYSLF